MKNVREIKQEIAGWFINFLWFTIGLSFRDIRKKLLIPRINQYDVLDNILKIILEIGSGVFFVDKNFYLMLINTVTVRRNNFYHFFFISLLIFLFTEMNV